MQSRSGAGANCGRQVRRQSQRLEELAGQVREKTATIERVEGQLRELLRRDWVRGERAEGDEPQDRRAAAHIRELERRTAVLQ